MESSPEHLATICVGYHERFWKRRNARENIFARPFLVYGRIRMSTEKCETVRLCHECSLLESLSACYSRGYSFKLQ